MKRGKKAINSDDLSLIAGLLERSDDIVYRYEIEPEPKYSYISPSIEKLTGYTAEEHYEDPYLYQKYIHPEDREDLKDLLQKRKKGFANIRIVHKNGSVHWVQRNETALFNPQNKPIAVEGIMRDITEIKEQEQALIDSEQRYRDLTENTLAGIYIIQEEKIVYCNHGLIKMLGYSSPDQLIGKPVMQFIAPEYRNIVQQEIRLREKGQKETSHYELAVIRADGTRLPIEALGQKSVYQGKPAVYGIFLNIMERKKAEQDLHVSETNYRHLIQHAPDAFFQINMTGNIILVNWNAVKLTGYAKTELQKMKVRDFFSPEELKQNPFRYDLLKKGKTLYKKRTLIRKDGQKVPVEIVARSMPDNTFIAFVRDISARIEAESQLRIQSSALDHAANGIIITNIDGDIEWVNKAFTSITGYSKKEVLGKTPRILKSDKHELLFYKNLWDTILQGKIWRDKIINKRKDGSFYTEELTIAPVFNDSGKITHFVGIQLDVTGQEKVLQELHKTLDRLHRLSDHTNEILEQERLEISRNLHDHLGQILTAIKMDLSWLLRKWTSTPDLVTRRIEETRSLVDQAIQSVQEINSGLRPSMLDELGLWETLEWLCQEMSKRSGIEIEMNLKHKFIRLPEQYVLPVYRVVQEAITNVVRHSGATKARLHITPLKDKILFSVSDNGTGIPENKLDSPENFGLIGMQQRIELLGGEFEIKRKTKGTEVLFNLPFL